MNAPCIGEGFKTIGKQIHVQEEKLWQNSFGPFVFLLFQQLKIFDGLSVH